MNKDIDILILNNKFNGSCLTVTFPLISLDRPEWNMKRWKIIVSKIRKKCGTNNLNFENVINKIEDLTSQLKFWKQSREGLVFFINSQGFHYEFLDHTPIPLIELAENINTFELLVAEIADRKSYVLSIDDNFCKLHSISGNNIWEVDISIGIVEKEHLFDNDINEDIGYFSINDDTTMETTDSQVLIHSDNKWDYIQNIYDGVKELISGQKTPLILIAKDEVYYTFKNINDYPYLLPEFVNSEPNQFNEEEILSSVHRILDDNYSKQLFELGSNYKDKTRLNPTFDSLDELVVASEMNKIDFILVNLQALRQLTNCSEIIEITRAIECAYSKGVIVKFYEDENNPKPILGALLD